MDDLIAKLRKGVVYGDPRNIGASGEFDEAETDGLMNIAATALEDAYAKISDQRAEIDLCGAALVGLFYDQSGAERFGWRGVADDPENDYACEYCGAENRDCEQIPHAPNCPVKLARAVIGKIELVRRGYGLEINLNKPLADRWREWCLAVALADSANKPSRQRSQDELDRVLLKAAEIIQTGAGK